MSNTKKNKQLGMNYSTASGRLVKDLLFKFAVELGHKCHQCGGDLTRNTFSVEHKVPWLDSDNPSDMFFDLDNIAFSHLSCNIKAGRRPHKYPDEETKKLAVRGNRKINRAKNYSSESRREKYLRTGT